MKTNEIEQFDARVDKFLRHEMTPEEELEFKSELQSDPEKLERARITALMIKKMQKVGAERDSNVVSQIQDMSEDQFRAKLGLKSKPPVNIDIAASVNRTVVNKPQDKAQPAAILVSKREGPNFMESLVRFAAAASFVAIICFAGSRYHHTIKLGKDHYLAYTTDLSEYQGIRGQVEDVSPRNPAITVQEELTSIFAKVENREDIRNTITELTEIQALAQDEISPYNEFLDDISWNLAIAYLKNGKRKASIQILQDMLKRNQGYPEITDPVEDLLKKLKTCKRGKK